jgi:hypothetical protein
MQTKKLERRKLQKLANYTDDDESQSSLKKQPYCNNP